VSVFFLCGNRAQQRPEKMAQNQAIAGCLKFSVLPHPAHAQDLESFSEKYRKFPL
jgi:hypothetical protein